MRRVRIVLPVFNDWDSLILLLRDLDQVAASLPAIEFAVSAVNDGSFVSSGDALRRLGTLQHLAQVEIVHLYSNLGHQRAIAIGICDAVEASDCDAILVMDADGEDSALAIPEILEKAGEERDFCVAVQRGRRSESLLFRLAYFLYKRLFYVFTGHQIAFGNFCLLSRNYARRLVTIADLWRNLPAAILRSRLPLRSVVVDRSKRYAGKSKMNLTSLIIHGLSGISVYAETTFVRLLVLTLLLFGLSGAVIATVLILRLFYPQYATPGWATTVSFGLAIILIQTLSVTLSFTLLLLHSRVQRLILPIADYKCYVERHEVIFRRSQPLPEGDGGEVVLPHEVKESV